MSNNSMVINKLVESCLTYEVKSFIPFLLNPEVIVAFPNKIRFYRYLSGLVECAQTRAIGQMHIILEEPSEYNFEGGQNLCFYDEKHKYPLIVLEFKEEDGKTYIDAHPF